VGGTINGRQVRGTIAQGGSGWASVYVGSDVHRKRSQMAVVAEDGKVQLNRNVVNGTEPILKLIGGLPGGTPVAFESAFGWGWLVQLLEDYSFDPLTPAALMGAAKSARPIQRLTESPWCSISPAMASGSHECQFPGCDSMTPGNGLSLALFGWGVTFDLKRRRRHAALTTHGISSAARRARANA
jgi:hypothetical protein